LGGLSSTAVKYRPNAGGASKKPKKPALTMPTRISCASAPTPMARSCSVNAAVRAKLVVQLVRST